MNRKSKYTITLPEPCPANREEMADVGKDKFCSQCQKTVIDFSAMSDGEIVYFLDKMKGQHLCGYFHSTQLNRQITTPALPGNKWHHFIGKVAASLLLVQTFTVDVFAQTNKKPKTHQQAKKPAPYVAGTLKGRVLDYNSSKPLAGAKVSIEELKQDTVTDNNGYFFFRLNDTTKEYYTLKATNGDLKVIHKEQVTLQQIRNLITLYQYDVEVMDEVIISYERPLMHDQGGMVWHEEPRILHAPKKNWFQRLFSRRK